MVEVTFITLLCLKSREETQHLQMTTRWLKIRLSLFSHLLTIFTSASFISSLLFYALKLIQIYLKQRTTSFSLCIGLISKIRHCFCLAKNRALKVFEEDFLQWINTFSFDEYIWNSRYCLIQHLCWCLLCALFMFTFLKISSKLTWKFTCDCCHVAKHAA